MRCEGVRARLEALDAGELAAAEAEAVLEHLRSCTACAAARERVAALAGALAEAAPALRRSAPAGVMGAVLREAADGMGVVETALGPMRVAFGPKGIRAVRSALEPEAEFVAWYAGRLGRPPVPREVPAALARAVADAAAGRGDRNAPVDLAAARGFQRTVLETIRRIPPGEARPYGWVAREAGRPRAVRAVGTALARNPVPLLVPCHRVVPASGGIGAYSLGGAGTKRAVLEAEGAPVDEMETLAREGTRYVGCRTTGIYCHPTCRHVRRVSPASRVPLADARAAARAGFRPCKVCRPAAAAA